MTNINDLNMQIELMKQKISTLEREVGNIPRTLSPLEKKAKALNNPIARPMTPFPLFGLHLGVCTDTRDPWKMGRIMIYCPSVHKLVDNGNFSESHLTWAKPCSPFGSIDDMGSVFIPPEGSVVICMFENGNRNSMFYIGTTWVPRRSTSENDDANFSPEREGYRRQYGLRNEDILTGLENNLLPPWNNESYFGKDLDPQIDDMKNESAAEELVIEADKTKNIRVIGDLLEERSGILGNDYSTQGWRSRDIPHIYGIKTPEKHFLQFVDGSYDRNEAKRSLWGKRVVLQSSKSNFLIFKDDNDLTSDEIYDHEFWDSKNDKSSISKQWFNKSENSHNIVLNHTGVQLQSFGGGRLIIDDKIEGDLKPKQNAWNSTFPPLPEKGKVFYRTMVRLESHTEHRITLSDHHVDKENKRSPLDGIFLSTACGHYIGMVDHTDEKGKADEERKILIKSTSGHELIMKDYRCSISSPGKRSQGSYSKSKHRSNRDNSVYDSPNYKSDGEGSGEQVCLKLKSGFGHYLLMEDGSQQDKLAEQYLILSNAPGWNDPHNFLKMNQYGNKLVHLSCAGERLTTVELNYSRITKQNETLISIEGNQTHIVENGNIIDIALVSNISHYCKLGSHSIYCENGYHSTFANQGTFHGSSGTHIILGGLNISDPENYSAPAPVLLLGGFSPLPAHPAKYLMAN